ncbi:hypothetical protein GALMADRAFT_103276 [Galerina marginata CBS 339.88]|uniref:Uncharacterized protein n=1 Tax=Galerina marginata (strain CBS 339.88) TaxID=685588 RepID=A0A067SGR7_GALM3|nr:hypothetical protein GALMADRAFT_103276 [Galerina marginata CBS 339.88]
MSPDMQNTTSNHKATATHIIEHDNVAHHPLGGGSYIFRSEFTQHINGHCPKNRIVLHIGSQPNSSPHIGTIITFTVAFFLAARLQQEHKRDVLICLDVVDTAPSQQLEIDGLRYQKSQRFTREMDNYMEDFVEILDALKNRTGVEYLVRTQSEFLGDPHVPTALREIIRNREVLGASFSPNKGNLAIRSACPRTDCGLADKDGVQNVYSYSDDKSTIEFRCPRHGPYTLNLFDLDHIRQLEFNTPLRNLLRTKVFACDPDASWIHVTGDDYSGYYQEQLLWRNIRHEEGLVIVYAPLIVDWSGAKLSKSLYVKSGAYQYLKDDNKDYIISYEIFKKQGKDLEVIFDEVMDWVKHPFKLFRSYSIAYIDALFQGDKPLQGEVGKP